jgi:hypothetical protein
MDESYATTGANWLAAPIFESFVVSRDVRGPNLPTNQYLQRVVGVGLLGLSGKVVVNLVSHFLPRKRHRFDVI